MQTSLNDVFSSKILRCKWSLPILVVLYEGPHRFSDLCKKISLDAKSLSRKLDILASHGYVEHVGQVYSLNKRGEILVDAAKLLTNHIPVTVVAEVLKCKWTKQILVGLLDSPKFSSEVVSAIRGLSWKVASNRFKKLVNSGLVRACYDLGARPIRVRYELTSKGKLFAAWLATHYPILEEDLNRTSAQSYYTVGAMKTTGE
ncbi:MAG: winged helix-turn-helix transcriptional regulator [Candidatus Caldarchaeum sp.]